MLGWSTPANCPDAYEGIRLVWAARYLGCSVFELVGKPGLVAWALALREGEEYAKRRKR